MAGLAFGAAPLLFETRGQMMRPIGRSELDRNVALARAQMEDGAFAAARAEGRVVMQ